MNAEEMKTEKHVNNNICYFQLTTTKKKTLQHINNYEMTYIAPKPVFVIGHIVFKP